MTLFICSLLMVLGSSISAGVLENHLKAVHPELHRSLHIEPWWFSTPPFWVFRFLAASKRNCLGRTDKVLAITSMVLISIGFALFAIFFLELGNPKQNPLAIHPSG